MDTTIETQAQRVRTGDYSLDSIATQYNHKIEGENSHGFTARCKDCHEPQQFGAKAELPRISVWLHYHYSNCPKRGGVAA